MTRTSRSPGAPRRGSFPVRLALSAWVYGATALLTLVFMATALPGAWLAKRLGHGPMAARLGIWYYGRAWVTLVAPVLPIERPRADVLAAPGLIVSNHASVFDLFCFGAQPAKNVIMVAKSWPFRLPYYGAFMRLAGYVDSQSAGWEELARAVTSALDEGVFVVVFPEGTRSRDGSLSRFKPGIFRLAIETGAPVYPLCIHGTHELLPPGRRLLAPSRLRLELLDPVDPAPYAGRDDGHLALRTEVKSRMKQALAPMASTATHKETEP